MTRIRPNTLFILFAQKTDELQNTCWRGDCRGCDCDYSIHIHLGKLIYNQDNNLYIDLHATIFVSNR